MKISQMRRTSDDCMESSHNCCLFAKGESFAFLMVPYGIYYPKHLESFLLFQMLARHRHSVGYIC